MRLIGYMNASTVPALIDIRHGMEYIMRHPHEPIMYSRMFYKTNEIPHQCLLKAWDTEIKNQE